MSNSRRGKDRGRRAFTPEFKTEALRVMREQRELGATLSAIGRELDVPPNLLRSWARRAKERDGGADPAVQSASAACRRRKKTTAAGGESGRPHKSVIFKSVGVLRAPRREVRLHHRAPKGFSAGRDVSRARGLAHGVQRLAASWPECAGAGQCASHAPHPRGAREEPPQLWGAADSRGATGAGRRVRAASRGAPDAGRWAAGETHEGVSRHDAVGACASRRRESSGAPLRAGAVAHPRSRVGDGHDVSLDTRRLALSRDGRRSHVATRRRLGGEHLARARAADQRRCRWRSLVGGARRVRSCIRIAAVNTRAPPISRCSRSTASCRA